MQAVNITIFLILFSGVAGIIGSMDIGLSDSENPIQNATEMRFSDISGDYQGSDDSGYWVGIKISFTSTLNFVKQIGDYALIGTVIENVFSRGMDRDGADYYTLGLIKNLVNIIQGMIYSLAIIQIWRKISIKNME